jgi:Uma2 family endonuclease
MADNDFIFNGEDFIDFIKTEEDMKLFQRLRELEPELHKPADQCIDIVIEVVNITDKLKGLPPRKFIKLNNPLLN